jgi:DNA mismatch repair protein MutS2
MDSLSTFSGHIASIRDALKELDKDSFLVIDEIGQGTSPSDGEALGVAVIDYIKAHGGFAILTSHYDGIKEKAFSDPSCLVGAMIFDEQTIKPTFRYQEGMIGKSYALEVSASLGLDSSIIQEAKDYVTEKNRQSGREALEQAIALQQENLRLKDEYEKKIKEAEELTAKRQRALDALSHEKEAVMRKADDKVDELVQSRIADLDLAYKNKKISLQQLAELKGKLSKMQVPNSPNQKKTAYHHPLAVGDKVNVGSLNNSGTLIQIDEKRGTASVKIGSIAVKTNVSDLTFLEAAGALKVKPQVAVQDQYIEHKTGVPLEVNLIGLRQDEAREKLDKYLDDCILMKFHQVRIIHGNGTGALRTMVQKYLKSNPNVASFRFGEGGEGGVGVTVATLK